MHTAIPRRDWLRQTALAMAGLSIASRLPAAPISVVRDVTGDIRLNANENPYGPPPAAREAMTAAIARTNRYAFSAATELREKLAQKHGLTKDNVILGAGSSDLLGLVTAYAALQKGHIISAYPTFAVWWGMAEKKGLPVIRVPLTPDKKHDLPAMLQRINDDTRMVYVCNPNNPTGTVLPQAALQNFVETASQRTLVLLDEAYTEYAGLPTLTPLVTNNKQLVVVKTFSKIYGMAGGRVGYAFAHADTIKALNELQAWTNYGPSAVSMAGAIAALDDKTFVNTSIEKNKAARDVACAALSDAGIPFVPSHTNFVYYSVEKYARDFQKMLQEHHILTGRVVEPEGKWIRTSIGTMEEMQQFAAVIKNTFK